MRKVLGWVVLERFAAVVAAEVVGLAFTDAAGGLAIHRDVDAGEIGVVLADEALSVRPF